MGGERQRVDAEGGDVAVRPSGELHRIAEDVAARRMDKGGGLCDRLDDAGLIVRALQRQQDPPRPPAGGLEPVKIDPPVGAKRRDLDRGGGKSMP